MGLNLVAPAVAALALASPTAFLEGHRSQDGGFAEAGGASSPALTAWAVLGLVAAGKKPDGALEYLRAHESDALPAPTRALVALAESALGDGRLAESLSIKPGQTNTIIWTILARRQAGLAAPKSLVTALLARQTKSGGWGWATGVGPDSNDTAAAVQALRAAGVAGTSVRRALGYLRTARNRDGGFALIPGRESDAQSSAWAIQAFLAAGAPVPKGAFAYLRRLRSADGSYRYSVRYAVTPVWVTSQVLPALMKKQFPFPRR